MRKLTVLPNAPFNRLNLHRQAEVGVNPLACIRLPTWEFKSFDFA